MYTNKRNPWAHLNPPISFLFLPAIKWMKPKLTPLSLDNCSFLHVAKRQGRTAEVCWGFLSLVLLGRPKGMGSWGPSDRKRYGDGRGGGKQVLYENFSRKGGLRLDSVPTLSYISLLHTTTSLRVHIRTLVRNFLPPVTLAPLFLP
ncbi:hypothetical protein SLEP1_g20270 [Rubroshorea leprosula]|uniref:Uncharacterized protein n=1 Tax=Rubroshorea leprosula TaxID=152421 RepID=A0AAV5J803_9ROSI|nr:hypothetical protein SLEP1_g20270 [Rubroshorea leprosula]